MNLLVADGEQDNDQKDQIEKQDQQDETPTRVKREVSAYQRSTWL